MQFLYLPVSSVAGNFPAIAAVVQVQQLLPLRGSPEVIKGFREVYSGGVWAYRCLADQSFLND